MMEISVTKNQLQQEIEAHQKVEAVLRSSLEEKDVLLKEIHHRVKNNLQIISSLLDLQGETEANFWVRQKFVESQSRVRSMALIHEQLYRAVDLARTDFAAYTETLVQ